MREEHENEEVQNVVNEELSEPNSHISLKDRLLDLPIPLQIALGLFVICIFTIIIALIVANYKSPIEKQADKFCACAYLPEQPSYTTSRDGFKYLSNLDSCFVLDFQKFSEGMHSDDKKAYLHDFSEYVESKCPQKLELVFKYD